MAHWDKQLEDARRQVEETRRQMDAEAAKRMANWDKQVEDARKQVEETRRQMDAEAAKRMDDGRKLMEGAREQMKAAHEQMEAARGEVTRPREASREQIAAERDEQWGGRPEQVKGELWHETTLDRQSGPVATEVPSDTDSFLTAALSRTSRSVLSEDCGDAVEPVDLTVAPDDSVPEQPQDTLQQEGVHDRSSKGALTPTDGFVSNVEFGEAPPSPPTNSVGGVEFDD